MQLLDTIQVGQRKGKPFSVFGCDEDIDVDGVNGLIALLIATTVAKRLPASGQAGEKNISHEGYSWWCIAAVVGLRYSSPIGLLDGNGPRYSCLMMKIVADTTVLVNKVHGVFPQGSVVSGGKDMAPWPWDLSALSLRRQATILRARISPARAWAMRYRLRAQCPLNESDASSSWRTRAKTASNITWVRRPVCVF